MRKRFLTFILLGIAAFIILAAVPNFINQSSVQAQPSANLLVSAAASLRESLEEIKPLYQKNQNVNINYNFGASGALQQQIENGAGVDVFISASKKQIDALQTKGLIINDTRRNLLTNRLVLIVPSNSSNITNFQQLTSPKVQRIAIGEPRSVPVGQYTEEVLKKLGIFEQIKSKFVLANNVRQVLAAVESGNADAGVVYITDANTSKRVKVVETAPENLHSPIIYPVAVLKDSKNIPAAKQYVQFLLDKQAGAIFEKYGFGIAK